MSADDVTACGIWCRVYVGLGGRAPGTAWDQDLEMN